MPIYEYRCGACGQRFERLQKMSDPDPERCPHCGAASVSRLISPVGFRLKGGGWYETDFKNAGRRNVGDADGAQPQGKADADKVAKEGTEKPAAQPAGEKAKKETKSSTDAAPGSKGESAA